MNKLLITGILLWSLLVPQVSWGENTVTRWVEQALEAVREQNVGTPDAGRLYAMVTVAMYDAVNGIDRMHRISRRAHALVPPTNAPLFASRDAAAAAAAHAVLIELTPNQADVLDAALAAEFEMLGGVTQPGVAAGRDWGEFVGREVVTLRENDGATPPETIPAGVGPGVHRAAFTNAQFRNMVPFGIQSKEPYVSPGPPALTSPEYTAAFNEVKTLGSDQDTDLERDEISDFWLAESGTSRETGIWLQAALAVVEQEGTVHSLSATARLFALLGMAIADAVIVSWEAKATYFFWRPTPAIHEADTDDNPDTVPDPTWTSRIGSAGGSPEHTSGTSTFAGAASTVLAGFYCHDDIAFTFLTDQASNGSRAYSSFSAAAAEAGRSRIYQGIHFEFSNQAGQHQGRGMGTEIVTTRLRRIGPQPPWTKVCPQW
jgi:hypothetical protein